MPKKKLKIDQEKTNEEFGGYIHRTDLRLVALQQTICELFKFDKKQKEKFDKAVESHYKILLQVSMENVEKEDPALAARLLAGQNPYLGLV